MSKVNNNDLKQSLGYVELFIKMNNKKVHVKPITKMPKINFQWRKRKQQSRYHYNTSITLLFYVLFELIVMLSLPKSINCEFFMRISDSKVDIDCASIDVHVI